jgi:hypothetical protein
VLKAKNSTQKLILEGRISKPAERHYYSRLKKSTVIKKHNSVVEKGVDIGADVAAINRGEGVLEGKDVSINGRIYEIEATGTIFPKSGEGVYYLNRNEMAILKEIKLTGSVEQAMPYLLKEDRPFTQIEINRVVEIYKKLEGN